MWNIFSQNQEMGGGGAGKIDLMEKDLECLNVVLWTVLITADRSLPQNSQLTNHLNQLFVMVNDYMFI